MVSIPSAQVSKLTVTSTPRHPSPTLVFSSYHLYFPWTSWPISVVSMTTLSVPKCYTCMNNDHLLPSSPAFPECKVNSFWSTYNGPGLGYIREQNTDPCPFERTFWWHDWQIQHAHTELISFLPLLLHLCLLSSRPHHSPSGLSSTSPSQGPKCCEVHTSLCDHTPLLRRPPALCHGTQPRLSDLPPLHLPCSIDIQLNLPFIHFHVPCPLARLFSCLHPPSFPRPGKCLRIL